MNVVIFYFILVFMIWINKIILNLCKTIIILYKTIIILYLMYCDSCKINKNTAVYDLYMEEISIINKLNISEEVIYNCIMPYLYHFNGHIIQYKLYSNIERYNICTTCFQSGIFKFLELDQRLPYNCKSLYLFNKVGIYIDQILFKNTGMRKYSNLRYSYQIREDRYKEKRDSDYMNKLKTYFKKYNFPDVYIIQKYRQTTPLYKNGFFHIAKLQMNNEEDSTLKFNSIYY